MANDKDWLTAVQEQFAAEDPEDAAAYERSKFVLELIQLRRMNGLSQDEVAQRMGLPRSRVGEIESRPWKVSLDRISAYARALGARLELAVPAASESRKVFMVAEKRRDPRS